MEKKNLVKINSYINQQIKLEEEYYDKIHALLLPLIAELNKYVEFGKNIKLVGILGIITTFTTRNMAKIYDLNYSYALMCVKLAHRAVHGDEMDVLVKLKTYYVQELYHEFNVKVNNLIDTIKGRYLALIPIGSRGNNFSMFTDTNTKKDLIQRNNTSISRFVQLAISEAVLNSIITDIKNMGATEYLADNQHDDRVREMHRKYFNGEDWIKFDSPPPCGHVATEQGCRCFITAYR